MGTLSYTCVRMQVSDLLVRADDQLPPAEAGGIVSLSKPLTDGTPDAKEEAAGALSSDDSEDDKPLSERLELVRSQKKQASRGKKKKDKSVLLKKPSKVATEHHYHVAIRHHKFYIDGEPCGPSLDWVGELSPTDVKTYKKGDPCEGLASSFPLPGKEKLLRRKKMKGERPSFNSGWRQSVYIIKPESNDPVFEAFKRNGHAQNDTEWVPDKELSAMYQHVSEIVSKNNTGLTGCTPSNIKQHNLIK